MKSLSLLTSALALVLVTSPSAFCDMSDVTITQSVQSYPMSLTDVKIKESGRTFSREDLFASSISFAITGTYSSGYCWVEGLAAQTIPHYNPADASDKETFELQILGLNDHVHANEKNGVVPVTSGACAGGSEGNFTLPIKISVTSWGQAQSHSWNYSMKTGFNGNGPKVNLVVRLGKDKGWTVVQKQ